jgi:hypothetical protein
MRHYPEKDDKWEQKELEELEAEPWMIAMLQYNPSYVHWGNGEDYMWETESQWGSEVEIHSVDKLWKLDEYNEVVNFYFQVNRKSTTCDACKGKFYNPKTLQLKEEWLLLTTGQKRNNQLKEDEIDMLWVIHPRKGASRGVLLTEIKEEELPKVVEYLKDARQRNWDRFAKLDSVPIKVQ